MSRKHRHEDHVNHEAWAIPYGDLVTLLLAFFVVMYAISSVNEGKYRVMSDSLAAAFRGSPRSMQPIQVGEKAVGAGANADSHVMNQAMLQGQPRSMLSPLPVNTVENSQFRPDGEQAAEYALHAQRTAATVKQLEQVADQVEQAMESLVKRNLISVRRHGLWVEVEIKTDILFPSGVAKLSDPAREVLTQLADTLKPFPNAMRVEGHTDNRPINTAAFPSNWELSSARAASVVHLFTQTGIAPTRLAVIGLGENRPSKPNDSVEGRNHNRRVVLVILGDNGEAPEGIYAEERGAAEESMPAATSTPAPLEIAPATAALQTPLIEASLAMPTAPPVEPN
jgi:chemotaxis protein MotB